MKTIYLIALLIGVIAQTNSNFKTLNHSLGSPQVVERIELAFNMGGN